MRVRSFLLITVVAACAPPGPSPSPSDPVVRVGTGGAPQNLDLGSASAPGIVTIAAPRDSVWQALARVYDSLAIPRNTFDPASQTIGNTGFLIRRTLGKVRLSEYIDCGSPQLRPSADYYDVNMSVLTQLQPDPSGATKVTTTVNATAKPVSIAGQFDRCSSTGRLETRLASLLNAELRR
jgi:hypothetical protein